MGGKLTIRTFKSLIFTPFVLLLFARVAVSKMPRSGTGDDD
jgi:hypothetical protein